MATCLIGSSRLGVGMVVTIIVMKIGRAKRAPSRGEVPEVEFTLADYEERHLTQLNREL